MVRLRVDSHLLVSHLKPTVRCQVALADMVMTKPLLVYGVRTAPLDILGTPQRAEITLSLDIRHEHTESYRTQETVALLIIWRITGSVSLPFLAVSIIYSF